MSSIFEQRIAKFLNKLYFKYSFDGSIAVKNIKYLKADYKKNDILPDDTNFFEYDNSIGWGGCADSHFWFSFDIDVPEEYANYVLSVRTGYSVWHASNPQFLVYIDGQLAQGLDENHTEIRLKKAGKQKVFLYAYTGSEVNAVLSLSVSVEKIRRNVRKLYYDLYVLSEIIGFSDEESREYKVNLFHINKVFSLLDMMSERLSDTEIEAAIKYLELNATGNASSFGTVYCFGQTHIDVEWLWTLDQTKEKVQRSFSNVLTLMDLYKDSTFFASTPLLYEYIKETQPELYKKILSLIKDGRWEPDGAMWVEADNIISGGESIIRQFLYGKQYFKDNFGIDSKILWLPDCFGYTGALPQIAKKCGVEWFITSKITWNDTNEFPHNIFKWVGIDGSELKTYLITTQAKLKDKYEPITAYNGMASARQIRGTYDRLKEKEFTDIVFSAYGWGDGGGGPTESMYEQLDFMKKGVEGLPAVKDATLKEFIKDLEIRLKNKELPKWIGELYFEYHRGTFTAIAKAKKKNREIEKLLSNLEFLFSINNDFNHQNNLKSMWMKVLTHQFHDALPGSSIKAVYEEMEKDYDNISCCLNSMIDDQINKIIKNDNLTGDAVVFNFNSREQSGYVNYNNKTYYIENVPPKGYKTISLKEETNSLFVSEDSIENDFYKIVFNAEYEIVEFIDKRLGRNIIKDGGVFNALRVYNDINLDYDAWELSEYHTEKVFSVNNVLNVEKFIDGAKCGLIIEKEFRNSIIKQTISLFAKDDIVDISNLIDWKENNLILKAEFQPDINADVANYNIQFGNIKRTTHNNTSYDRAQFEVPMHKFMDYSDGGYGVAIINDCKYGGVVKEGKMSLSLIRSPQYPYKEADKCVHEFSYAIYPHETCALSTITDKAYNYNNKLYLVPLKGKNCNQSKTYITCSNSNIIIETVKPAEDKNGYIIRLYDCANVKSVAKISLPKKAVKIVDCDMLENEQTVLAENSNIFTLNVNNYEIKTIKVISNE